MAKEGAEQGDAVPVITVSCCSGAKLPGASGSPADTGSLPAPGKLLSHLLHSCCCFVMLASPVRFS